MSFIHYIRRMFCFALAALLVCSGILGTAANVNNQNTSVKTKESAELFIESIVYNDASEYGYSDYTVVDENGKVISDNSLQSHSGDLDEFVMSGSYDDKYDAREHNIVSNSKYQGISGSCWAFSAISGMETSMAKQGLSEGIDDYSEAHLVYFTYNSLVEDENSSIYGDGHKVSDPFMQGGNWLRVVATLANGTGAELEQYAPFNTKDFDAMVFDERIRNESYARLKSAVKLADGSQNTIKQAILDYGSVTFAYYSDTSCYHYTKDNMSYYCGIADGLSANHAATIIGWDDNYSKENFKSSVRPEENGAWLVKNSWSDDWGEGGCFWISYEEPSMKTFVAYEAEAVGEYDNIYQYDGSGYSNIVGLGDNKSISMANVFVADKNEALKAVSFYTVQDDQDYKVEIYTDPESVPNDGELVSSKSGNIKYQGYYTIELDEMVNLEEGQRFAVVVTVTAKNDSVAKVAVEGPSMGIFNFSSKEGTSFVTVPGAGYWYDCSAQNINNVCIKAFTTGVDKTELISAINEAELLKKEEYSASSWKPFFEQLEYARSLYEDDNACGAFIENCIIRLNALIDSLEPSTDIIISSADDLINLSNRVNGGDSLDEVSVILNNDLNMLDVEGFLPIGTSEFPFKGLFDGQGYIISDITISSEDDKACGLFGYLGENGFIKNVSLSNAAISGSGNIGGICAYSNGTIENCGFSGTITADDMEQSFAGSIVGHAQSGKITNCKSSAKIESQSGIAGGIVGFGNSIEITNCGFTGSVSSEVQAGGIAGSITSGSINNSFSTANIKAPIVGGIALSEIADSEIDSNELKLSINNCYSASELEGETCYPIAKGDAVLENCYFVSEQQIDGAMTAEQMKMKRFAYTLNQGVKDNWAQWTQNSDINGGYPVFAQDDNAVTTKPCIVTFDMGYGETETIYDINADTVIELPKLESRINEVFCGWSDGENVFEDEYMVTDDITITAIFKKPTTVEIKDAPEQMVLGQELILDNSVIIVTFEDETVREYPATPDMIELEAFSTGEHIATLNFYGATCQFAVVIVAPESECVIGIGTAETQAGETVEIPITLSGSPNICSMAFSIDFDTTALSLIEVSSNIKDIFSWETIEDKYIVRFKSSEPIDLNGVIATLKFEVSDDIGNGEYSINLNYDMREMIGEESQMLLFALQSGCISVTEGEDLNGVKKGDVNGDGNIDLLDGVILCRYLDEAYSNIIINVTAADLDDNDVINENDIELLRAMLVEQCYFD